ncbi:hypothetical protein F5X99DRAFT_372541, partial [Biscogniauxia marginata]
SPLPHSLLLLFSLLSSLFSPFFLSPLLTRIQYSFLAAFPTCLLHLPMNTRHAGDWRDAMQCCIHFVNETK